MAKASSLFDLRAHLPGLHLPVLLVWGRQDRITPLEVGMEFQALLPQAALAVIEDCGHAPPLEQPEAFSQIMLAFLEGLAFLEEPRVRTAARQDDDGIGAVSLGRRPR